MAQRCFDCSGWLFRGPSNGLYHFPVTLYTSAMDLIKSFVLGGFPCQTAFYTPGEVYPSETALFVADRHTAPLIENSPGGTPLSCPRIILTPGEGEKQWPAVQTILNKAMEEGLARDSVICGAGGGVVTDISAFAGSLYMRGCRVILIPTSLLAMVDAALGGKTGIDAGGYKNMIGSFYPAEEIRICPEFLQSLPEKEYWNGMGEVFKTALIGDSDLMALLAKEKEKIRNREPGVLKDMIQRCIRVKGALVEEDLREKGRRVYLNLGHTFGHALESVTSFGWSHGAAVVWGLAKALDAGVMRGITDPSWAESVKDVLRDYGYKLSCSAHPKELLKAMLMDKKKKGGRLRYILPAGPEDIRIAYLEPSFVEQVLTEK